MDEVRVVIVFSNQLVNIFVDGDEMDDFLVIRNKPIADCFFRQEDAMVGGGLVTEIRKMIGDENANSNLGFQGSQESKQDFEKAMRKYGLGDNADGMPAAFYGDSYLLLDRYFLSVDAIKELGNQNSQNKFHAYLITKAKRFAVAYELALPRRPRQRGAPRKKGGQHQAYVPVPDLA